MARVLEELMLLERTQPSIEGGPAPADVERMLTEKKKQLAEATEHLDLIQQQRYRRLRIFPKVTLSSGGTRVLLLIGFMIPALIDFLIISAALPVALRITEPTALSEAIAVIFAAPSGGGWAALLAGFFAPHILATCLLTFWAWKVRELDGEQFVKATETARSLVSGYFALFVLLLLIFIIQMSDVGWRDVFTTALSELIRPLIPVLSVAAIVATFGPGYSKHNEGLALVLPKGGAP